MSQVKSFTHAERAAVSRTRKAVSSAVLAVVVIVLAIELRAAIGHAQSVKALTAVAPEGLFEKTFQAEIESKLLLFPAESVVRSNIDEHVVRYHWFSILRPLIGQPELELFVVAAPEEPRQAFAFYTDPDEAGAGFYGDKVPAEDAVEAYQKMEAADPFGIPDAPPTAATRI